MHTQSALREEPPITFEGLLAKISCLPANAPTYQKEDDGIRRFKRAALGRFPRSEREFTENDLGALLLHLGIASVDELPSVMAYFRREDRRHEYVDGVDCCCLGVIRAQVSGDGRAGYRVETYKVKDR